MMSADTYVVSLSIDILYNIILDVYYTGCYNENLDIFAKGLTIAMRMLVWTMLQEFHRPRRILLVFDQRW